MVQLRLEIDILHYGHSILYGQVDSDMITVKTGLETAKSLPDAKIVHTGQQPELLTLTQAEYSLIVSCLTITFLQPLQLTSKDPSSLFTVMLFLNSIIITLFWIMFQSRFSCFYWTPLANALMLWDYLLGMKCLIPKCLTSPRAEN